LPRLGSGVRVSFPAPNSKSPDRKIGAFFIVDMIVFFKMFL